MWITPVGTDVVVMVVSNDADTSKLRQNDCQLSKFDAYSHDAEDDNDDLTNPATPITSVSTAAVRHCVNAICRSRLQFQ